MTVWQAFFLGIMVGWTPGFVVLALFLWTASELEDQPR